MTRALDSARVIAQLLGDPAGCGYYGAHLPDRRLRSGLTPVAAHHESTLLVKALRRDGRPEARRVARRLALCRPRHRCLSGACSECVTALASAVEDAGTHHYVETAEDWAVTNAVPVGVAVLYGRCGEKDLLAPVAAQLHRLLDRAGLVAIGGIDISANEHAHGAFPDHYRPHGWLPLPGIHKAEARKRLKGLLRSSAHVRRPVVTNGFDGKGRGFAYGIRPNLDRRDTVPREEMPDGSTKRQRVRRKPIREPQRVELAIALDREGLASRLFLHGYRIEVRQGRLRFVRDAEDISQ